MGVFIERLVLLSLGLASLRGAHGKEGVQTIESCSLLIDNRSVTYFLSRLKIDQPNMIYFNVILNGTQPKYTREVFYPQKWVWTYATKRRVYPYLHWNIDYDIFSFKLLDAKTLKSMPYVTLHAKGSCNLTFGSQETSELIVEQLKHLVLDPGHPCINKYEHSYWCFMAEVPGIRQTVEYYLALYLGYPVTFMKYRCCETYYNYTSTSLMYQSKCVNKQKNIWPQCTLYPYILGILLFLYCPIILLELAAFLSKRQFVRDAKTLSETLPLLRNTESETSFQEETGPMDETLWIYLDGTVPISFTDIFRNLFPDGHPIALSRLRRFILVVLAPFVIYTKIIIYDHVQFKTTNDLMDRGVPFGFLALIAKTHNGRYKSFVPAFGGPITIALGFYIISLILLVFPENVSQIITTGLPRGTSKISPLCFGTSQILQLSQIPVKHVRGYKSIANLLRCSFQMVFSTLFWRKIVKIQRSRFKVPERDQTPLLKILCKCLLPLYVILCVTEILVCIFYYLIPLAGFIAVIARCTSAFVADKMRKGGRISNFLLNSKLFVVSLTLVVAVIMTFYAYSACLVFIDSFFLLTQFLVYSYLAVIIYPSVSFGYLFFAVILIYYIFRLIRGFGHRYLDLLNDVVEISLSLEQHDNHVTNFDGNIVISNLKISSVKSIKINGKVLAVPRNRIHSFSNTSIQAECRVRAKNNTWGVRKDLFEHVVTKHSPVHQQVLKIVLELALIVLLLWVTNTLTAGFFTGPSSQISEVMHVIFIITVGALPRVLEVAMSDSTEHIAHDIKMRNLEDTINRYWQTIEMNGTLMA